MKFIRPKTIQKKQNKAEKEDNEIWDRAIELYLKDNDKLLDYKGYSPIMLRHNENLETHLDSDEESEQNEKDKAEPDERNQLLQNDFEEIDSGGEVYTSLQGWKGNMYVPPAFRCNYQISIWKTDEYGVVKIQEKYFTPENKRASDIKFQGFNLQLSLDEQTMLMIEKDQEKQRDLLVISFDLYSLEILSEILVDTVDESIADEPYYRGRAAETQESGPYHIGEYIPKITSWNFGKLILAMVT